MRRSSLALGMAGALGLLLLSAVPAGAHATFPISGVAAGSTQVLTMDVPHERGDEVFNTSVVIAIPAGWQAKGCDAQPTWTCALGTDGGRQVVRFTKNAGTGPSGADEQFSFSVQAPSSAGDGYFPTVQSYSDGAVSRWINTGGAGEPAPKLVVAGAGQAPPPPPANPGNQDHSRPPASQATTTRAPTNTTAAPAVTTTSPTASNVPGPGGQPPGGAAPGSPDGEGQGPTTTSGSASVAAGKIVIKPRAAGPTFREPTIEEPESAAATRDITSIGEGTAFAWALGLLALLGAELFVHALMSASQRRHSPTGAGR